MLEQGYEAGKGPEEDFQRIGQTNTSTGGASEAICALAGGICATNEGVGPNTHRVKGLWW